MTLRQDIDIIKAMKQVDNKRMKIEQGEYLTVLELSKMLGENTDTIKKRLFRLGIKPLSRDALYPASVVDSLRDSPPRGRPKTTTENKQAKNGKASAKPTTSKKQGSKKK